MQKHENQIKMYIKPKINLYQSLVDIEERIDEYRDKLDKVGV